MRDYVRPVWRRKWLILAIVVLATAGTYALASRRHSTAARITQYTSSTQVYIEVADPVEQIGSTGVPNPPDGQQMSDLATLFTAQSITQAVYHHLGKPVGSAGSVNVGLLDTRSATAYGTSIIVVQATSTTARLAALLANTYVTEFLASRDSAEAAAASADAAATRAQIGTLPNISSNASERRALQLQVAQYDEIVRNPNPGAYQVSPAPLPAATIVTSGSARTPIVDALIALVVSLLLGIGLAFGLALFDRRLLRVSAVESSYGRAVLAVLAHVSKPALNARPVVPPEFVESLRSLRVNLRLSPNGSSPRTLVVTSAVPGEGKSTVACNLALVCSESGERVLLIDADLRRPGVADWFGIDTEIGLTQMLRGGASFAETVVTVRPMHHGEARDNGGPRREVRGDPRAHGQLDVLAHGELLDVPAPLLSSRAMAAMLDAAGRRYDLVIIDTAPLLAVADTVPLLGEADAVLVVARLGVTTRDVAERLGEVVGRVPDANWLGVVANDARAAFLDSGYGGLYVGGRGGYGYRNGHGGAARDRKTAAIAG